jgi:cell division transport system permease protein
VKRVAKAVRLALAGAREVLRRPWPLAGATAGVAVAVLLCGLAALAGLALDRAFDYSQGRVRFQVYWKPGADPALVARQADWMRALPGLVETRSFTPAQALAVMSQALGRDADLPALGGQNPLPHTMLLTFRAPVADPGFFKDVYDRLAAVEGVAEVRYNPREVDMAQAVGQIGGRLALPLAGALTLLVGLVVGNTVRLTLLRRREEVEILRLVGASESYIRGPLVAGAGLVGLLGGAVAMGLLALVRVLLAGLLDVPPLFLALPELPAWLAAAFILGTGLVAALAGLAAAMESES